MPIQYADFAVWQRRRLQGEVLEQQLSYWRGQLGDELPVLELPTDRPRPPEESHRGAELREYVSGAVLDSLGALAMREGATLYMTMLAAFCVLLHRHSGQTDIVIGSPVAGRNRRETEGLIGFFINSLVLRVDISGDPTFRELLTRVRTVTLEALSHQDIPFEKLVEELKPRRDPGRNPLFQVSFGAVEAAVSQLNLDGIEIGPAARV